MNMIGTQQRNSFSTRKVPMNWGPRRTDVAQLDNYYVSGSEIEFIIEACYMFPGLQESQHSTTIPSIVLYASKPVGTY